MARCSRHCVVTAYRESGFVLAEWSGTTDDSRNVGAPINKKWTYYDGWLKAVKAGLEAHWPKEDDCPHDEDDGCTCDTDKNKLGPRQQASATRKVKRPSRSPATQLLHSRDLHPRVATTDGVCLGDPNEEDECAMLVLAGDIVAMLDEAGVTAARKRPTRSKRG